MNCHYKRTHGVPALFSFFIPGFGQIVIETMKNMARLIGNTVWTSASGKKPDNMEHARFPKDCRP